MRIKHPRTPNTTMNSFSHISPYAIYYWCQPLLTAKRNSNKLARKPSHTAERRDRTGHNSLWFIWRSLPQSSGQVTEIICWLVFNVLGDLLQASQNTDMIYAVCKISTTCSWNITVVNNLHELIRCHSIKLHIIKSIERSTKQCNSPVKVASHIMSINVSIKPVYLVRESPLALAIVFSGEWWWLISSKQIEMNDIHFNLGFMGLSINNSIFIQWLNKLPFQIPITETVLFKCIIAQWLVHINQYVHNINLSINLINS